MQLFIEKNIKFVIDSLYANGFEAYLVGGCVRDMLMGKTPHDYDIATNALPCEVEKVFEKTVLTGAKHGTVTVIVDKTPVEVTTYRTEGEYTDFRRPDTVEFVSDIKYDLSRRDFTINAMAYNEKSGLIDLFGGKEDLKNKLLKTVGDSKIRFHEDALRILRLYRFSSTLNLKIEKDTENWAIASVNLLKNVSVERIFTELTKAVLGDNTAVLKPLISANALNFLQIDKFENLEKISLLPKDMCLRLFAFLHLASSNLKNSLTLLKASNLQKKYCLDLEEMLNQQTPTRKLEIKAFLGKYSPKEFSDFLVFIETVLGIDTTNQKNLLNEILENNEPYLISDLCIDGNDLKKLGYSGIEIKAKLGELLNLVCEDPKLNQKQTLIKLISK